MTKQEKYLRKAEINFGKATMIMRKKSGDYAQPDDPYANFRGAEFLGVDLKKGILIRVMDKISRLNNLLTRKAIVKESIEDTCLDLINYVNIFLMKFQSEGENYED